MRGIETRLAKLEYSLTPYDPINTYTQDRIGGTGLFRRSGGDGALMTREQVAQDAQGATAIVLIYQSHEPQPGIDADLTQIWIPDNGRGDSD